MRSLAIAVGVLVALVAAPVAADTLSGDVNRADGLMDPEQHLRQVAPMQRVGDFTPLTADDIADLCLGGLDVGGGRLRIDRVAPDLPGLCEGWVDEGVERGFAARVGSDEIVLTAAGRTWLHRDRSVTIGVSRPEKP